MQIEKLAKFIDFYNYVPIMINKIRHKNDSSDDLATFMGKIKDIPENLKINLEEYEEDEEYIPQTIHRSQIISIHNDNPDIKGTVRVGCNQIPCTSLSSQTVQILIVRTHSSSQKFHELRRRRGEK